MNRNSLMTWIRLATLAAITLAPAMACSYTATVASAVVPATGGSVQIAINTQPGCVWQLSSLNPWVSLNTTSGNGTAMVQVSVASNAGSQRAGIVQGMGTCDSTGVASASGCSTTALIPFQTAIIQQ